MLCRYMRPTPPPPAPPSPPDIEQAPEQEAVECLSYIGTEGGRWISQTTVDKCVRASTLFADNAAADVGR